MQTFSGRLPGRLPVQKLRVKLTKLRLCVKYMHFMRNLQLPTAIPMFSGSSSPIRLFAMLRNETGSGKSKMAVSHLEILIAQLVHKKATKFQRLYLCFRGQATRLDHCRDCPTGILVVNQRWRHVTGSRNDIMYISACIHDKNEIPTAIPLFSGLGNMEELRRTLSDRKVNEKSKMTNINWN